MENVLKMLKGKEEAIECQYQHDVAYYNRELLKLASVVSPELREFKETIDNSYKERLVAVQKRISSLELHKG